MKDLNYEKIILWLENQDRIELNNNEIESLLILNVTNNFAFSDKKVYKYQECEDFMLVLSKDIYEKHYIDLCDNVSENTIEDRMKNNDILSIEIIFNKNENEYINVVWNDELDYTNSYQSMIYYEDKLAIRCNKYGKAEDF